MAQSFGGPWTLIKLEMLEKYLNFYIRAMKNQPFKLCYIDAFAGSGNVDVKGIGSISGSALRAIDYAFDRYIFIDKNPEYLNLLEAKIKERDPNKVIELRVGDCNEVLRTINSSHWYEEYWRGVVFLDPYAMNLKWESLEALAQTQAFDVWYLFPLSATNRVLRRDGKLPESHKRIINDLLGTNEWEREIYHESPQLSLFGDPDIERVTIDQIAAYLPRRLKTIFSDVSKHPSVLKNPVNNSPLFLLCFAVSNKSPKAIELSLKAADHILAHTS